VTISVGATIGDRLPLEGGPGPAAESPPNPYILLNSAGAWIGALASSRIDELGDRHIIVLR
jgi:hypothetical protein